MAKGDSREWIPPAEKLTDDLLVEILSRVPYKSLCRFKCVCRRWLRVISHPDHRHLLPRYHLETNLAGFFHSDSLTNVTQGKTGLSSTPRSRSCPGVTVSTSWTAAMASSSAAAGGLPISGRFDYLVVNPATEQWVALP